MRRHMAAGLRLEDLDCVVIEDSKSMQTILRSTFNAAKVARLRVFDRADHALEAMLSEPPHLIVTDWFMKPMSGAKLLKTLRTPGMAPLCYIPVLVITAHATRRMVDFAARSGAHQVVVKPFAPSELIRRIEAVLADERALTLNPASGVVRIDGIERVLEETSAKWVALEKARAFHEGLAAAGRKVRTPDPAPGVDTADVLPFAAVDRPAEPAPERRSGFAAVVRPDRDGGGGAGQRRRRAA